MEIIFMATILMDTWPIIFCLATIFTSSYLIYEKSYYTGYFSPSKFIGGYIGIIAACAIISAALVYVPPDVSVSTFKIEPDKYWEVIKREFIVVFIVFTYFSLIGTAIFGMPVIYVLAKKDLATIPAVLGASIAISTVFSALISLSSQKSINTFIDLTLSITVIHLLTTFAFCIGARFRWKPYKKT